MARSKYTPDRIELIYAVLEKTGSDRAVCSDPEIGISEATYYQWQKEKSEFLEGVAKAKEQYRITQPKWQRYQANQVLARYLSEGAIDTWQSEEIAYDADGDLRGRKVIIKTCHRGVPKWVIERVLGKNSDLEDALLVLIEAGLATDDELRIVSQGLTKLKQDLKAARAKRHSPV
jgi:hypothetical protein